jgi:8-oxo-dGTP diphosphatase
MIAASVAVFRDDRVLLAARGRPPLADIWSLPGGLVETGETLAEAALRELAEETGVVAEIIGFVRPIEFIERDEGGRVRHHFVICPHAARWVSGDGVVSAEAPALAWVTRADIGRHRTTPGLVPILALAFDMSREHGGAGN